jgi:hypothetical protein
VEALGRDRATTLGTEDVGTRRLLPLQAAECPKLVALDWVDAWRSPLASANVEPPGIEFDLMPLQIADLRSAKAVPVGDQDHDGVAMPIPARLTSRGHQLFDLIGGQIFPGALN